MSNKYRVFQGCDTKQINSDGTKAEPDGWYFEPCDYEGDVLWSGAFDTEAAAREWAEHGRLTPRFIAAKHGVEVPRADIQDPHFYEK